MYAYKVDFGRPTKASTTYLAHNAEEARKQFRHENNVRGRADIRTTFLGERDHDMLPNDPH